MTSDQPIPAHQKRVLDEHAELRGRLTKLKSFVETDVFRSLSQSEQDLLELQITPMWQYLNILEKRIQLF